ncbi:XdhC family protein [Neobacillus cucumis]|uniref:Xanthine dehydrogenase n=1 Tax=Neobacillus cucumis TaxID=1740721 RepID=A0A2N5HCJ7_9BACI|nr:XdhC family protein [Neobacillus cucumis]PLS03228.1 xanthine dehydrogenase [Neobacillus cucumis]
MDGIHEILDVIYGSVTDDVLATIIRVEGSAYRKEGTSMLFRGDGTQIGLLSAGCLEKDLSYHVQDVINQRNTKTIVYDLRDEDDLSWGQGAGCNGVISVLLEPIDACLREHLCKLKFHLDSGRRVTMIKKLSKDYSVSDYLFMTDEQQLFGKWHGRLSLQIKSLLNCIHQSLPKSGITFSQELSADLYLHCFEPKPRLIVFGAGRDAVPLVSMASQAGFSVLVSDWRPALCKEKFFPDADQLFMGFPSEVMSMLSLSSIDSVIILTHHFQRDRELLHLLKGHKLRYLGVLGSKARTKRLFDGREIPPEITSPVGLPIGAEGPEEIAISIVAELIQRQRLKKPEKAMARERSWSSYD